MTAGSSPVAVLAYHNDLARTGQNLNETILTLANVNPTTFGKKFTDPVDGQVYAQPLYVPNVTIPGQGSHSVVYIATENDSVYAFDADAAGAPLWQTSLLNGGSPVPSSDTNCGQITPQIGITSTPVIDAASNTLYVVAMTKEGSSTNPMYVQRLHALDITNGQEKLGGPVVITATIPGTGDGSSGGNITFNPLWQLNRPGLTLANGNVYIAFGSHCDLFPYHGWLFAYGASNLAQSGVFITTPTGSQGAIWQAGGAPAVDSSNHLYVITGNGTFDGNTGGLDFGDSFLKLVQVGSTLTRADYFTPFNQARLAATDADLGSAGPTVLPDQLGAHPHLLASAGKGGTIYLLDRDNLGKFCNNCTSDTQVVQSLPDALGENFGTAAFWNGKVYFLAANDVLKAFSLTNGVLSSSPSSQTTTPFGFPGSTPSISANGAANGIVWVLQTDAAGSGGPAVLHAYDANNVATELYNSNQAAGDRDIPGPAVKFTVPTVANGKVYVGTADQLDVYGPLL